jgi:hypothetical protein
MKLRNRHDWHWKSMVTVTIRATRSNEPIEFESDNKTAEVEIDLQLTIKKKLAKAIDKKMNSKITSKSRTTKDITSIKKKKFSYFRNRRQKWSYFWELLRTFEFNTTKTRTWCEREHVDLLRGYFKRENNWLLIKKRLSKTVKQLGTNIN